MRTCLPAVLFVIAGFRAQADPPAACGEAAELHRSGQFLEAVDRYGDGLQALDGDPAAMADAYHRRGRAHMKLGDLDAAMTLQTPAGVAKTRDHLRAAGYDPGPSDGVYGPLTREALTACVADACNTWN